MEVFAIIVVIIWSITSLSAIIASFVALPYAIKEYRIRHEEEVVAAKYGRRLLILTASMADNSRLLKNAHIGFLVAHLLFFVPGAVSLWRYIFEDVPTDDTDYLRKAVLQISLTLGQVVVLVTQSFIVRATARQKRAREELESHDADEG